MSEIGDFSANRCRALSRCQSPSWPYGVDQGTGPPSGPATVRSPGEPEKAQLAVDHTLSNVPQKSIWPFVAGLHCVDWSWTEDVETRTVCITADGVLLRFVVDDKIVSEARSVSYGPQPVELFQVPQGYTPLLAPEGGPVP